MKWLMLGLSLGAAWCAVLCFPGGQAAETPRGQRSPVDLAVLPGGRQVLVANQSADSVALVDLQEGRVVVERAVGHKPSAVACSRDGKRAAVSNLWSGSVTLLTIADNRLSVVETLAVGALPRGLVFAADGASFYVALAGSDEVAEVDFAKRQVSHRWLAPREPWDVALSADGRTLAVASSRSAQVRCWDTESRKLRWERGIYYAFNLRGLSFSADGQDLVFGFVYNRERPVTQNNIGEGWLLDNRMAKLPLEPDQQSDSWQMALDFRGQAVADPHGVAASPDGRWLAVAGSGSHELVIMERGFIPWSPGEPGDFADIALEVGAHKMRRVELGGRPLTVAFTDRGRTVAVVNSLLDAVQVVDVETATLLRTIPLGAAVKPAPARLGEAIFYDAQRSHHQWFSCHTCHTEGHTSGQAFDTLNDDSYGNPKQVPSLRLVTKTGPWTWHGWQKELEASISKSLTETMFGPAPKGDDIKNMMAYFATLEPPPNPHRQAGGAFSPAAERGQAVFNGKARCARCHKGEFYTSESNYDLKLGYDASPYEGWNPPTLINLWDRGPFMHDGRATTLEQLLEKHHVPEKLGGQPLTEQEKRDLVEFLKAL